jgi:hypothetical protein
MKQTLRWSLGLILTVGLTGVGQSAAARLPQPSLTVTIHVHNYAEVDHKTLMEAEKVATQIFRKAGVETLWVETVMTAQNNQENSAEWSSFAPPHIWLTILPRPIADVLNLSNNVLGLAPGTGPDRHVIYVFYNRVEVLSQKLATARLEGKIKNVVTTSQILGHAIAHELGHVLLNIETHSETGIMRGDWNTKDLQDASSGLLIFTSQQAEVIRAEIARRVRQAPEGTAHESSTLTR